MKRFLRLTQEADFGQIDPTAPVSFYPRLDRGGAFKPMTTPQFWTVMSGSGFAVPAVFGSETTALGGTLVTPLTYTNASFLLGWALTRINAGQTLPWATTEKPGDLASVTADFAWSNFDASLRRKEWPGNKVVTLGLSGSTDSPVMMLSLGITGGVAGGVALPADPDATAFPEPADSVYATDFVLFQHLRGGLTLNNVARSNFQSIAINVQNRCRPYWDESRYPNAIRMNGRSTTITGNSRLKAVPDDRTLYEAATKMASANTLVFTNGTHTITFTLGPNNYFSNIDENMEIDEEIYYPWTITNLLDPANGTINPDLNWSYS